MKSDAALLREFAEARAEEAFAELVRRHVNLVYSTALRGTNGNAALAQDAAQAVFTDLARKASALCRRESLSGWLYTSAHFAAAKLVRTEQRRRDREEKYMADPTQASGSETDWETLRPVLDDVMHELPAGDREAILMRYFENRGFAEVGSRLGLTENAARMRVDRAVEKLRGLLAKRGVATSAALVSIISAHAVQVAPAGLAALLTTSSVAAAAQTGTALTILKIMTATKLKLGLGALVTVGAVTALVVQHQAQGTLRTENETLREQLAQLKTENEGLANPPVAASSNAMTDPQFNELLRLRGEVGLLRRQTNELGNKLANAQNPNPRRSNAAAEQQAAAASAEDYPRTPEAATKGIFETWARGDWDAFFTKFGEPGAPKEMYDRAFSDPVKSNYLYGMEVVNIGQPTNSFGPNMWFVPYKIRFRDGTEKEFQLHIGQDQRTQRWYFKGGF